MTQCNENKQICYRHMYSDKTTQDIGARTGFILMRFNSNTKKFKKTCIKMLDRERFGTIIANNKQII